MYSSLHWKIIYSMSIVTATIKSEGETLPAKYQLISISINREVNRIPFAELVLLDGDPAEQTFELSEQPFFEPGKEIEIQLRYEGESTGDQTVFKGLVLKHNLEATSLQSTLNISLEDTAVGMTKRRNSRVFQNQTDATMIKTLIEEGGLATGDISTTETTYEELVQYYCTDWDFMMSRAEANNLIVLVEDGKISLQKLEISNLAKYEIEYGISEIYSFEMEADASYQYKTIESVSWDIKSQQLSQKSNAADFSLAQSNLNGATIAAKFGGDTQLLSSTVPLDPKEAQAWADATMARSRMSMIKGVVAVSGFAEAQLMDTIELAGFSKRFNGKTLITGIKHTIDEEGWITYLQFGLNANSFARSPHILDVPAAGLLPAVQGLQIGIVDAFQEDTEGKEFRVRVILPGLDSATGKVWARLSSPDAGLGMEGQGRGYFFRPEKGDEVIVGFFNDDPRQAVILGSLYSSKNVPPPGWENLDEKNSFKGIVSKTGIAIAINDEDQTLTFSTSAEQSVCVDEKNKKIEIIDINQNTITLDENGVHIKTAKNLLVEARGDLDLKGKNINLEASANVVIKGSHVDVK